MKPLTRIVDFVLAQSETQPLAVRISLYRDLAAIAATAKQARDLTALADELAAVEAKHQQLVLDFQRRNLSAHPFGKDGN